jgi:hypothetical protein
LWLRDRSADPGEVSAFLRSETGEVTEVATKVISALMSYDADTIAARRDELEPLSTESFQTQYEEILSGGLDEALTRTGIVAEGELVTGPDPAFISATRAAATARVVQEVTSEQRSPRTIFYVVRVILVSEDGGWKADELEILAQQSSP